MTTRAVPALAPLSYDQWQAEHYFSFYYRDGIVRDEQITLERHLARLRLNGRTYERALDYGCGPTLHNAIAVAPYVARLEMADWRTDNLASIARWVRGARGASRWGHFTRYIMQCEGEAAPDNTEVARREALARRRIRRLLQSDARQPLPLGPERSAYYDLLVSGYCLECISDDRAVWRAAVRNVLATLAPGGTLLLDALWKCRSYQVGERWFPSADVDVDDLHRCLIEAGIEPRSLEIEAYPCPEQEACGYPGILVATGTKAGRLQ